MQENKYAVGLDIGTTTVRCVVGSIDATSGTPTIVGVGTAPNSGMRKGMVVTLGGPAKAIDEALGEAERMSGYQVDIASISINGTHLLSTKADGMIAVSGGEVRYEDVGRIEEVATVGKIPANREILEVVPYAYRLDGQDNIKDPIGMNGTRLELTANVVSALGPHLANLQKTADLAKVYPKSITPAGLAAAKAVLTESQKENGVALVDIGGATTSVAIFEEGDLQHFSVLPVGGINITNDLAIGLKTDPEIAEIVKLTHATLQKRDSSDVTVKHDKQLYTFSTVDIDEIVEARAEEIFTAVHKELQRIGRAGQLPNGIVLTGGSSNIKGIAEYAKQQMNVSARIGVSTGYGGVADHIEEPQFATAIGLMLIDAEHADDTPHAGKGLHGAKSSLKQANSVVQKFLSRFKA